MTETITTRNATPHDLDTIVHLKSIGFKHDPAEERVKLENDARFSYKNTILAEIKGQPVGAAHLFPAQMWLSGVPIQLGAISGLATHPDHQNKGVAKTIVTQLLQKMAKQGVALSAVFPRKRKVYQSLGYTSVAQWHLYNIAPATIPTSGEVKHTRPFEPADLAPLRSLYRGTQLSQGDGRLNRPNSFWETLVAEEKRTSPNHIIIYHTGEDLEGYLKYTITSNQTLNVIEIFASTDAAYQGLWTHLATQSNITSITYVAPSDDFLLNYLPNAQDNYKTVTNFMLRIIDVKEALTSRFYPYGLMGNRVLKIHDPQLPHNQELLRFRIVDGRPDTLPLEGKPPEVETDIMTLAQIFCGFISPAAAQTEAKLQASAESVQWLSEAISMTRTPYILQDDWF